MARAKLDVAPGNRSGEKSGLSCTAGKDIPPRYKSYEYRKLDKQSFELTDLTYDGHRISYVFETHVEDVLKIIAYFIETRDDLLAIHVASKTKHYYYINNYIKQALNKDVEFDDFMTKGSEPLSSEEIKTILSDVDIKYRLNYDGLSSTTKEKLWRFADIIFDLSKIPKGEDCYYHSDITNAEVTAKDKNLASHRYPKIKHEPAEKVFYIKGLKNGQKNIDVADGFPIDPLEEFYVYYDNGGNANPLLVTLKVKHFSDTSGDIGYYYLSKNDTTGKWDKFIVDRTDFMVDELKAILDNIKQYKKLNLDQLDKKIKDKLKKPTTRSASNKNNNSPGTTVSETNNKKKSNKIGIIIAGVVGGVVGAVLLAVAVWKLGPIAKSSLAKKDTLL